MTSSSESQRSGPHRGLVFAAAIAVAVAVALAALKPGSGQTAAKAQASPPARVVPQLELVHAETFALEQPYPHRWRVDAPLVRSGWLLVLAGDPALLQVRQMQMPVLQVGAMTAERINTGQQSGKLVVLVPGDFALAGAPIFLGSPALPEELRQDQLDAELAAARADGAVAPTAAAIAKATKEGRSYANDYELRLRAIDLVEQYSPVEKELIAGWRVPLVK
jgi:hypothetical protein